MKENAIEGEGILQGSAAPEQHPEQPGLRLGGCGRSLGGRGLTYRDGIMQINHSLLANISGLGSLVMAACTFFQQRTKFSLEARLRSHSAGCSQSCGQGASTPLPGLGTHQSLLAWKRLGLWGGSLPF